MRTAGRTWRVSFRLLIALLPAVAAGTLDAAEPSGQSPPATPASATASAPKNWTTAQDHQNMMEQLGIKSLRPGPSGNENAPNHANYDESKANPYPDLPDVLTTRDGKKVTTAEMWWKQRRPEIVEDFDREVLGRVPKDVPKVTWTVTSTSDGTAGTRATVVKQLVGRVDNASCPEIDVDLRMTLVTPADAEGPVPVMMMFGFGGFPRTAPARPGAPGAATRFTSRPGGRGTFAGGDPPATQQLIAAGWGYATIVPNSIQADNGAGLTRGITGLCNKGQPRKPDDWGALRAWAWGASRALDYLETDRTVDARRVGIEGVSRFGKAALVTWPSIPASPSASSHRLEREAPSFIGGTSARPWKTSREAVAITGWRATF